jgi:hypothetical protein
MNKLQIIEEIFGDNYTPYLSPILSLSKNFYRAYPRKQNWISSRDLTTAIKKAEQHGARIGVCFTEKCFDVYFTENL